MARQGNFRPRVYSKPVSVEPLEPRLLFSPITTLGSFQTTGSSGSPPAGRVFIQFHPAGNDEIPPAGYVLYGTTTSGGSSSDGTIWDGGETALASVFSFNGADGADPANGVIIDPVSGDFVGTTLSGGASNDGVIFDYNGVDMTLRASFDGFTGGTGSGNAPSGLVEDASGNLFGIAHLGTSSLDIFELASGSSTITTLATLSGQFNGSQLVIDSNGDLFGALSQGAGGAHGSVFELVKGAGSVTTLATFTTVDEPYLDLVMDGSGNLFGATFGNGRSTLFEVASGSGVVTTLSVLSTGMLASGGLAIDPSGNLYGSATGGAAGANGIIFELANGSGTITTLASFDGTNGTAPQEPIIGGASDLGGGDDLFGVTTGGGAFGQGALWGLNLTVPAGGMSVTAPANAIDGIALNPPVMVKLFDELDNQMDSNASVTIALQSGVLAGTLTEPFTNGVATFSDVAFNSVQGLEQLTATSSATSNPGLFGDINVSLPSTTKLVFTQQPATVVSGLPIVPPVIVDVEDSSGNVINGPQTLITLSLIGAGGTLTGGVVGNNLPAVDVFSDLVINGPGTYQFLAIGGGAEAMSASFVVLPAGSSNPAAAKLAFVTAPTLATTNQPLSYSVAIEDSAGNVVTADSTQVSLSFGGPVPLGPLTASAVNGIATFSGISFGTIGIYSAVASDGSLTQAFSTVSAVLLSVPTFEFGGIPISPEGVQFEEARNEARLTGQPVDFVPSAQMALTGVFAMPSGSFAAAPPLASDQIAQTSVGASASDDPTLSPADAIDKLLGAI
jgi:uncharacterized repeat protein (TIGR03803 family)